MQKKKKTTSALQACPHHISNINLTHSLSSNICYGTRLEKKNIINHLSV